MIAALVTAVENWKQPNYPPMGERVIHAGTSTPGRRNCSATKRSKLLQLPTAPSISEKRYAKGKPPQPRLRTVGLRVYDMLEKATP